MKRSLAPIAVAAALLPAAPAVAGTSWLATERDFYRPGQIASVEAVFGTGTYEGSVRDGPFRAYLVERGDRLGRGEVRRRVVDLGRIEIERSRGHRCCWEASLRFEVPDVPAGEYWLEYCNVLCTVDRIGDLTPAPVLIGATVREARLGRRLQAAERRLERVERRGDRGPSLAEGEQMRAVEAPAVDQTGRERGSGLLPLGIGLVAGLLLGLVVRRRPKVVALVPYDPLSPPTARRSTRRRLR